MIDLTGRLLDITRDYRTRKPVITFEVTDPDAPLWCISFLPPQGGVIRTVKLYAESGCAAELTVTEAVG